MKILITNVQLDHRTGTEVVVRDLEAELRRRGHCVCVYTPSPGGIADEIRAAGGTVVSDIADVPYTPEIIHGHHHLPTVEAMLRFPHVPAIFVCHDRMQWQDVPPRSPSLQTYVAVDWNCRERLISEGGLDPSNIRLIHNAVDLDRFIPRGALPTPPRRAAVFANNATEGGYHDHVHAACTAAGIELDVFGIGVDRSIDAPESILGDYDLVFAKARCALEALATGCAVVLVDRAGLGEMVTASTVEWMRDWNFGARCLQRAVTRSGVESEIARYDASDAAAVTAWIRQRAGLRTSVDAYEAAYVHAAAHRAPAPPQAHSWVDAYRQLAEHTGGLENLLRSVDELVLMAPLSQAADAQLCLTVVAHPVIATTASTHVVRVELRNDSNERLASSGAHPLRFAYRWLDAESGEIIEPEGLRTDITKTVRAGTTHSQAMSVLALPTARRAVLRITLVQEGLRWLDHGAPPVSADVQIEVRDVDPSQWRLTDIAPLIDVVPTGFDVRRDAAVDNLGFVSRPLPNMLTFAENAAFLHRAVECPATSSVIVPPELADAVPQRLGVVTSTAPRRAFLDVHHNLANRSLFYGVREASEIHRTARVHSTAFVDPMGVRIGPGVEIGPSAVVLGPAVIGSATRVDAGVVVGSSGFQTVDVDGELFEMHHAGGVVVGAGCVLFANSVIGRGLFRQQTKLGDGCRIGNGAFVSHNADIGERAFVGHGAVVNGNVTIGAGAWVGPGAIVANNLTIGAGARVTLGCTVITDVADGAHVTGPSAVGHWTMMRAMGRLRQGQREHE